MGKKKNRIEKRAAEADFDTEAVREAYLRGESPTVISLRYGRQNCRAITNFISTHKQEWLDAARFNRLMADERRIVIPRRVVGEAGASYIMPISLPRISMHIAALREGA